jgi:hypothetical protein
MYVTEEIAFADESQLQAIYGFTGCLGLLDWDLWLS